MNKIRALRRSDGLYYGRATCGVRTSGFLIPKRARRVAANMILNKSDFGSMANSRCRRRKKEGIK
jgi:hypothetical protein